MPDVGAHAQDVKLVSVVLPIHNQADHLERLVGTYETALAALPVRHELLLVTNACRDESVAIADGLSAELSAVEHVPADRPGWGHAVRVGLAAARGDILCYTNSARTSPETLTMMLHVALTYPHAVLKANRTMRDSRRRRLGSLLYNLECRLLLGLAVWDINGTPKVFPRSFERLLRLSRDDDLIDAEFNLVCRDAAYPVLEVPILAFTRHGGDSTTSLRSAFHMYGGALTLKRRLPHG